MNPIWILYMGTYPPRECGIATFTKDLTTAIDKKFSPSIKSKIVAMNDRSSNNFNYPQDVIFEINDNNILEYIDVAKKINKIEAIKLINIQHEFGIFGGDYGEYVITFLEHLKKPVIITFHSVIPNPDVKLKNIVYTLSEKCSCLIVMTKEGTNILREDYDISTNIILIPHGAPIVPFIPSIEGKMKKGLSDKIILSSFGLVNPGKGYEYVIKALSEVVKKFPNILYIITGETHPVIRRKEGEKYRNFLKNIVKDLNLEDNVKFDNRYVSLKEIIHLLQATDIYISSNLNPNQIVSGTLAYAMASGKVILSTPFIHAKDVLTPERGILVKFRDSTSYTNAIIKVLSNPILKEKIEKKIYSYTRNTIWPNVALSYFKIFKKFIVKLGNFNLSNPKIKFNYIEKLTDDFGIIQFANYSIPNKFSGYTLDDNARAMIVSTIYHDLFKDNNKLKLIKKYLNFIKYVQQDDFKFYNFVDHEKKINFEHWSDDSHGRAMWSLGYLIASKTIPEGLRNEAQEIFEKGLAVIEKIKSPRAIAFIIIGLYFYNKRNKNSENRINKLSDYLVSLYYNCRTNEWHWFENYLTYSNSKLPEALFYSYKITNNKKYLKIAKKTLDFLITKTFMNGLFSPIGQNGWYFKNGDKALFDQQPIDTALMVHTLILAFKITNLKKYIKLADTAFKWFLGKNSLNQVIYDETTGGCHDGIGKFSINLNQGAESSVMYLIARLAIEELKRIKLI